MTTIRTRVNLTPEHYKWLKAMEAKGVDRNSIIAIAMALNALIPRTGNIGTTDCRIRSVVAGQKIADRKLTEKEPEF